MKSLRIIAGVAVFLIAMTVTAMTMAPKSTPDDTGSTATVVSVEHAETGCLIVFNSEGDLIPVEATGPECDIEPGDKVGF